MRLGGRGGDRLQTYRLMVVERYERGIARSLDRPLSAEKHVLMTKEHVWARGWSAAPGPYTCRAVRFPDGPTIHYFQPALTPHLADGAYL